jgi:ATP-binding cassette, subfamily B, bacterial
MKKENLNNQLIDIAESLLDDHHILNFSMHGNSMYPTMKEGDCGQVGKCHPDDLKIGDIVVFKLHGKLVAHRLIDIFQQKEVRMFMAKGDKNFQKDAPFTERDIIGIITSIQRNGKTIKIDSRLMKYHHYIAGHFSKILIPVYDLQLRAKSHFLSLKNSLEQFRHNLRLITEKSGKLFLSNSVIAILQGIFPFLIIVCIKSLIDQLTKSTTSGFQQPSVFIALLIATALVFLASAVLSEISSYYLEKLSQSVSKRIYAKLHSKHASLDLSNYENSEKQDKIHRAVQEASYRPVKILNELLVGIKSVASALFLIGLFISIRWYLVFILLIAIAPGVFLRLKISRKLYRLKESQSTREREMYYYNRILTGFPFAKELRLFGFVDFFEHRFTVTQNTLFSQKIELRKSEIRLGIIAQLFAVTLIFLSLGFVSYLKITNEISIGTVVLFFFAFQRGYSVLNDFFRSITQILEDNTFLKDFTDFLNIPTRSALPSDTEQTFSLQKEIRFENVSFRYESSKRDALKSVNLTIPAGKTVAFVGANGSGKTTMIKLLCGFYSPDSGKIYFDKTDSEEIGQKSICHNITAVFQDFALYNITASENIELGNIHIKPEVDRAREAATAAGVGSVLEKLPDGYDTLLGNLFKGGEELSIGQWQKIAIARAFYRDSPLLLMDEPSSALDADSELQIINSLKKLSHNKTAVIISHRLTTVQWADLIYFFEEGQVKESGNHEELMNLKGKYYSLFQTAKNEL